MEIKQFGEIIREEMERRVGMEVRIQQVPKNNGVILHGLNIVEPESNIFPTIYLEYFLEAYENGISLEDIIEKINETYQQEKLELKFDMEWFRDWEKIKEHVAYKLINFSDNKELLEKIPHERVLDLAKVYYVTVYNKMIGSGTILIHNTHLTMWNINTKELSAVATENTPRLFPVEIHRMGDMMKALYEEMEQEPTDEEEEFMKQCDLFIATNKSKTFGAAAMCYPNALKEIAEEIGTDLYILPCSLHEIILVVPKRSDDSAALRNMVYEVNRTQLQPEEVLSDSVYYYNRAKDTITIA